MGQLEGQLEEWEAQEAEKVKQFLGNRSVDQFLQLPRKEREEIYCRALTAPGFLWMLYHQVQHEYLGAGVLLCRKCVTSEAARSPRSP